MTNYGNSTLALVNDVLSGDVKHAVLLMRHSAREYDRNINDLLNPLTEAGREYAAALGERLPKDILLRGYASPPERCMETAELIFEGHQQHGGQVTRCREMESLGVFYALDQRRMWKGIVESEGGLTDFLGQWFAGKVSPGAMMPPKLAATLVLRTLVDKLQSPVTKPQLDICVSHDMTVHLLRDRLLDEPVTGPAVEYLDALILYQDDAGLWLRSQHGSAKAVSTAI